MDNTPPSVTTLFQDATKPVTTFLVTTLFQDATKPVTTLLVTTLFQDATKPVTTLFQDATKCQLGPWNDLPI